MRYNLIHNRFANADQVDTDKSDADYFSVKSQ